ncbi:MAG: WD40 repeat domain-containing protein [Spirochaetaceae bacterium]|nr:WD40 repeat domain-containing protein [Spirochaetaceae bacterium]
MAKGKKIYAIIIAVFAFLVYTVFAAQPVPRETILTSRWLKPLESAYPGDIPAGGGLIPFTLGNRFGYADSGGGILLNQVREGTVSLSPEYWAEYSAAPDELVIHDPRSNTELVISRPRGYPFFLDGRIFIISKDQTSLEEIDPSGNTLWTYDYEAPLTCIDAAGGYVFTGTLDGMIDLLDKNGLSVFPSYAPGASRIPVILGCRISSDGSKLAVISGIDKQRFLFLEWYGDNEYRVTYHEFLKGEGFRREVHMAFIDNDSRVVFEQEEGLGVYDIASRSTVTLPLPGNIEALDEDGGDGLFFFVTSGEGGEKRFVGLKLPDTELLNVPFKSETSFLTRRGKELFIGGGMTLASFILDKR